MSLFDTIAGGLGGATKSAGGGIAEGIAKSHLPAGMGSVVTAGKSLVNGQGIVSTTETLFSSGIFNPILGRAGTVIDQARHMNTPMKLMGGLTPAKAKEYYQKAVALNRAKKNLFLLEITDLRPAPDYSGDDMVSQGIEGTINMFAIDIAYSPWTITGNRQKIGATTTYSVNSSEPMEIRITTMDDEAGTIKSWFRGKCKQAVHVDGTVGLPIDYLVKIRLIHAAITVENGVSVNAYSETMYMAPSNIDMELSRRDHGLEELVLTFVQYSNFFPVT